MKKCRVGVIGGGAIAQSSHIVGYAANPDCELVAIADVCEASLAMVREKWSFQKEYSDYKEMLEKEQLDVVSICTPNKFHASMAIDVLKHGIDVVLEKPIALSLADGLEIEAVSKQVNKRVFTCFSHRFDDLIVDAKKALEEDMIGKPYMVRVRFAHKGPWPGWAKTDWFYKKELSGGGALLDMAVHAFDLVQFLIGDVTAVSAKASTLRKNIEVDDNVVALLEFGNDCLGYVEAGWTSPAGFMGVEIMGDNGSMIADYAAGTLFVTSGQINPDGTREVVKKTISENPRPRWECQMAEITRRIIAGEKPSPDIADGIKALAITLAAYESSDTGSRVQI